MNIRVYIDRLVLDGLPIDAHQGPLVQAAVEAELSRLLAEHGIAPGLQTGIAVPSLRAIGIEFTKELDPAGIGTQIAQSVFGGLGDTRGGSQ